MKRVVIAGKNGFGGREYSIAWKIHQQNPDVELHFFPGNGGTDQLGVNHPVTDWDSMIEEIVKLRPLLVIPGPEADLQAGIVDELESRGVPCFGPRKDAARLETRKLFAKKVMEVEGVPTANYHYFSPDKLQESIILPFLRENPDYRVLKANGLAGGKGVVVLDQDSFEEDARDFLTELVEGGYSGSGKSGLLIEETMEGEEASLFYLCNTKSSTLIPWKGTQDHKRVFEGDKGPNTGGMGAYSDTPLLSESDIQRITGDIAKPLMLGLQALDIEYVGVLYVGLMLKEDRARVVEINARFGDPEIQCLLPRLKSNLLDTFLRVREGSSQEIELEFDENQTVNVVLCSGGYPSSVKKGLPIQGLQSVPEDIQLFHAGTVKVGEEVQTNGGRVLNLVASAQNVVEARKRIYDFLEGNTLNFEGMFYRKDISSKVDRYLNGKHS